MPFSGVTQQQPQIVPAPFKKTEAPKAPIAAKPAVPPGQAAGVETNTPEKVLNKIEEISTDAEKVAEMLEDTEAPPVTAKKKAPAKRKAFPKRKASPKKKAPAKKKG